MRRSPSVAWSACYTFASGRQKVQEVATALKVLEFSTAKRQPIIAIDGPSGAGKGTVARAIAEKMGCRHVDTGAMYRAVGWKAIQEGVSLTDDQAVAALAERSEIDLSGARVTLDHEDVTRALRTPVIDRAAAAVARLPTVRALMVERQRRIGSRGGIVMEGRDIGTVVFPDADVKIYLDASEAERASRRAGDPAHSGGSPAEIAAALSERDKIDRTRDSSPLRAAADAVVVDTTGRSVAEVVDEVLRIVRGKIGS
jgi:CMP/dCMP kinase